MNGWQRLILFIWFYVGWFVCVYLARSGREALTLLIPLVSWVLYFVWQKPNWPRVEGLLILAGVGIVFDGFAISRGWLELTQASSWIVPLWLIAMWFLFVSVLPLSYRIFSQRLIFAGLLGAIFGPLSYYSGEELGVLRLDGWLAISIYAVFWMMYFPLAMVIQRKFQ